MKVRALPTECAPVPWRGCPLWLACGRCGPGSCVRSGPGTRGSAPCWQPGPLALRTRCAGVPVRPNPPETSPQIGLWELNFDWSRSGRESEGDMISWQPLAGRRALAQGQDKWPSADNNAVHESTNYTETTLQIRGHLFLRGISITEKRLTEDHFSLQYKYPFQKRVPLEWSDSMACFLFLSKHMPRWWDTMSTCRWLQ